MGPQHSETVLHLPKTGCFVHDLSTPLSMFRLLLDQLERWGWRAWWEGAMNLTDP